MVTLLDFIHLTHFMQAAFWAAEPPFRLGDCMDGNISASLGEQRLTFLFVRAPRSGERDLFQQTLASALSSISKTTITIKIGACQQFPLSDSLSKTQTHP